MRCYCLHLSELARVRSEADTKEPHNIKACGYGMSVDATIHHKESGPVYPDRPISYYLGFRADAYNSW